MKTCLKCGAEIAEDAKFCESCGAELGKADVQWCTECSAELEAREKQWVESLYEQEDYDTVIAKFTNAINLDQNNAAAYNDRGLAYSNNGEYELAIEDFTHAIKLDPNAYQLYFNRGDAYRENGDYNPAIEDFTRTISLNSEYAEAYNRRGSSFLNKEDYDMAIADFNEAIRLDQNNASAYNNRGVAYADGKGDYEWAIADYKKAIKLNPNTSARHNIKDAKAALKALKKESGGCFITTAVCGSFGKPDDCRELTAFRNFRDNWLARQPDGKTLVTEYYDIAPRIVAVIDAAPNSGAVYRGIWDNYLAECLRLIERGEFESCKRRYVAMVEELEEKYA